MTEQPPAALTAEELAEAEAVLTPEQRAERLAERVRVALLGGDHVWVVHARFTAGQQALLAAAETGDLSGLAIGAGNLVALEVECEVCRQPWTPRLLRRRCAGKPKPWRPA